MSKRKPEDKFIVLDGKEKEEMREFFEQASKEIEYIDGRQFRLASIRSLLGLPPWPEPRVE